MMTLEKIAEALSEVERRRRDVWDSLWQQKSIGRIAVGILPSEERIEVAKKACEGLQLDEPDEQSEGRTEEWHKALLDDLSALYTATQTPGDAFPSLNVPRFVHGQSQGMCDIFGVQVEEQTDGNQFVHPLPPDPEQVDAVQPRPIQESMYWGTVEWLRYARAATGARFPFRMPVMTGPFDTANYLLGTTTLCEWVHTYPDTVHRLMDKILQVNIAFIRALQEAAGGIVHDGCALCTRGGFEICSECRSIISLEIYEEFEAPRLRQIGEQCGPYGIHACGGWERTVPSAVADPNLRVMQGQSKENDLAELCELADGQITFAIRESGGLDEIYCWPDSQSFYAHALDTVPANQPMEIAISEAELPLWNRLCKERGKITIGMERGNE